MKILLFGADGQVGWELQRSLQPLGDVVALTRKTEPAIDFRQPDLAIDAIHRVSPDVIVNAAAYTAVDQAEDETETARQVNCETPRQIALAARQTGALLVHYSTDYVFDGAGTAPFGEDWPTNPLNAYGATKRDGEIAIAMSGCRHLIFRTSWVYARRGRNFVKTMLELSKTREVLRVVADQVGSPTGADLIADVTAHAVARFNSAGQGGGLFHLSAAGETSWHGLASFALSEARKLGWPVVTQSIVPIPSSEYPQKAKRPLNSRLSTARLRDQFALHLPEWQAGVARVVRELA